MKRFIAFLVCSLILGFVPSKTFASENETELTSSEKSFSQCVDEKRNVTVLYLVDESKSLQKSDPQNRRVNAIEGSIRAFYSMVKSSKNLRVPFTVNVKIAGFSSSYNNRSNWVRLDKGSDEFATADKKLESLLRDVANIANRNVVPFTNTPAGLQNSINEIIAAPSTETGTCRMLLFFSDGEMDLDNNPTSLNEKEQKALRSDICGEGQIADRLRQNEIFTATIGLSVKVKDFKPNLGLMKLLSTDSGSYSRTRKSGGGVFTLTSCGTLQAYGAHVESTNPDDLVKNLIKFTPDAPDTRLILGRCAEGLNPNGTEQGASGSSPGNESDSSDEMVEDETQVGNADEECRQVTFSITDATRSFKLLLTRSDPKQSVGLFSPADRGSVEDLFRGDESTKQVAIFPLGSKSSLVEVSRSDSNEPWNGKWSVVFRGPNASTSTVDVKFIGGLSVVLNANDPSGKNRVTRDETNDLDFEIVSASKTPVSFSMDNVELTVRINGTSMKVSARDVVRGVWYLSKSQVSNLVTGSGVFAKSSSMKIEVRPSANVEVFPAQTVKILFDPTFEEIGISNGNGYPTCIKSGAPLVVKEKNPVKIDFTCSGPKQGDGIFEFKSIEIEKTSFDPKFQVTTSKNDLKCRIKQNAQQYICSVVLEPQESHNGPISLVLNAASSGTDSDSVAPKPSNTDLVIEMSRPIKRPVLWKWIIGLIALFVFVQALIRVVFSMAMSRFEPLSVNYRYLAVSVTLLRSADGVKMRRNGNGLYAAESEAPNLVTLSEPKTRLMIDDFSFNASWIETFLKIGSTPKGRVSNAGSYVFGTLGTSSVKNGTSVGLVNLALPSQWAISVDSDLFRELKLGKTEQTSARLLCVLKPFESFGNGIDGQLSDVNVEILTKLEAMINSIEIKQDSEEQTDDSSSSLVSDGWADSISSGWGTESSPIRDAQEPSPKKTRQKKSRKDKKKNVSDSSSSEDSGWSTDDSSSGWN